MTGRTGAIGCDQDTVGAPGVLVNAVTWQSPELVSVLARGDAWRTDPARARSQFVSAYRRLSGLLIDAIGPPRSPGALPVWTWVAGLPEEAIACPGPVGCAGGCRHRAAPPEGEVVATLRVPRSALMGLEWYGWERILAGSPGDASVDLAPLIEVLPPDGWDPFQPWRGRYVQGVCWEVRPEWVRGLTLVTPDPVTGGLRTSPAPVTGGPRTPPVPSTARLHSTPRGSAPPPMEAQL